MEITKMNILHCRVTFHIFLDVNLIRFVSIEREFENLQVLKLHFFLPSGNSFVTVNYFVINFRSILSSNAITYLPKEVFLSLKNLRQL